VEAGAGPWASRALDEAAKRTNQGRPPSPDAHCRDEGPDQALPGPVITPPRI